MQQRRRIEDRLKQIRSFEERLAHDAKRLREEAKFLHPALSVRLRSGKPGNRLTRERVAAIFWPPRCAPAAARPTSWSIAPTTSARTRSTCQPINGPTP
jgi:hypothetical protein